MSNLHTLIMQLVALEETTLNVFADGKLTVPEKFKLGLAAANLAFIPWKDIAKEYKAMSPDDLATLHANIAGSLDLTNDKAEVITRQVIAIAAAKAIIAKTLRS